MLLPVTNCYVIGQVVAASSIGFSVHGHLPRCPLLRYARPFYFGDTPSPFTFYVHSTLIVLNLQVQDINQKVFAKQHQHRQRRLSLQLCMNRGMSLCTYNERKL